MTFVKYRNVTIWGGERRKEVSRPLRPRLLGTEPGMRHAQRENPSDEPWSGERTIVKNSLHRVPLEREY